MSRHLDQVLLEELRDLMEEGFSELLQVFLKESAEQYEALQRAWDRGEHEQVRRLAHSLKGCCSNLGARECAGLASGLEQAAVHADWGVIPGLLQQLDAELAATRTELGGWSAAR